MSEARVLPSTINLNFCYLNFILVCGYTIKFYSSLFFRFIFIHLTLISLEEFILLFSCYLIENLICVEVLNMLTNKTIYRSINNILTHVATFTEMRWRRQKLFAINSFSYYQVDISQPWADQESCCSWPSPPSPSARSGEPVRTMSAPTTHLRGNPRPPWLWTLEINVITRPMWMVNLTHDLRVSRADIWYSRECFKKRTKRREKEDYIKPVEITLKS